MAGAFDKERAEPYPKGGDAFGLDDLKRRAGISKSKYSSDDVNPKYAFSTMDTELLVQFATGKLDPIQFAKMAMAERGLDQTGKWIGFDEAAKLWK